MNDTPRIPLPRTKPEKGMVQIALKFRNAQNASTPRPSWPVGLSTWHRDAA